MRESVIGMSWQRVERPVRWSVTETRHLRGAFGWTGEHIAVYRRRRGLSQAALSGLVGRSESWLSQVERGIRSVDRLSVLIDMAKILHVDVKSLTLWLIAAVAATRRTDQGEAWARLDAAERLAGLLGEDANHAWTAFGPAKMRIPSGDSCRGLGDPGEALRAATDVDPPEVDGGTA